MIFFGLFKRREREAGTAPVARERLQVLLAHDRASSGQPNLMAILKDEIIAAIGRHVAVRPEGVSVRIDRREAVPVLRIAVNMPK